MKETALTFDTHTDIQELVQSGMPEAQAEIVVRQRVRQPEHNFATRSDIEAVKADIEKSRLETNASIEKSRLETRADIAETNANIEMLRQETKADIAETNASIEKLRLETNASIEAVKADIEKSRLETQTLIALSKNDMIRWFIGVSLGAGALIVAAIKLL